MSYCAKIRSLVEVSSSSDYEKSRPYEGSYTITPDEYRLVDVVNVGTTAQTYYIDHLNTVALSGVQGVLIENLDTTNYIEAQWYYELGEQNPGVTGYTFGNDNPDTITDADAAGTFVTGALAEAGAYVQITDSATAVRDGTYLIQTAAADVLTLGADHDLASIGGVDVTGTDAGSTIHIQRRNKEGILAGGWIFIGLRNLAAAQNITLQANTAACDVAISFFGT